MAIGRGKAPVDPGRPERREPGQKRLPVAAYAARPIDHLVEHAGQRAVARQERRDAVVIECERVLAGHAAIGHGPVA